MAETQEKQPEQRAPKSVLTEEDRRELNLKVLTTKTDVMDPVEYEQQRKIAQQMFDSSALPSTYANVDQVFMAIQIGHGAGLNPYQAINYGYFIDGKYNIFGMNTPLVIRNGGWTFDFFNESDDGCSAKFTNPKTGEAFEETFTFQEAVDSGFVNKWSSKQSKMVESLGWKKGANRKRKLRYGVLSLALHTRIPEVMAGIAGVAEYTTDYIEGESSTAEERAENRKQRMEAAEAERRAMADNGFEPQVVEPIEEETAPDAE